jgi:plastocyanin
LPQAVVSLHSAAAQAALQVGGAVMDQVNSEFEPRVLAVAVGSEISFPNSDKTRHHVYSFSPAKRFELPLYSGTTIDPVRFEQAGVVTVGCNIHDWMVGFIIVLDTPYRAVTDAQGRVRIDLPAGAYTLQVWHERLSESDAVGAQRPVEIVAGDNPPIELSLPLQPPPPARGDDRLRALQDKFRSLKRDPH